MCGLHKNKRQKTMKYEKIKRIAETYKQLFKPFCERIEIAGSIRREKAEPNDIELVAIPKRQAGRVRTELYDFMQRAGYEFIKNGDRYKQINLPEGVKLDLFLCNKNNWGNIFLIRTGCWEFSRWMMGFKINEFGYKASDGCLWNMKTSERLSCYEEKEIFKLVEMDYIEPRDRVMKKENKLMPI